MSNKDWKSPVDPDARIAKLKDGRTHLAHKPEHVVDLDSSAIMAVQIHQAYKGDTEIMHDTLANAKRNLKAALGKATPKYYSPADLAADKGYHARNALVKTVSSAAESANPSAKDSTTGMETRMHVERSTTTEHVCKHRLVKSCKSYAQSVLNEVSLTVWTVAECDEHIFVAPRTSKSGT